MIARPPYKFTPEKAHVDVRPIGSYKERVTKRAIQYLLLYKPTITIAGKVHEWGWDHLGVGVYELWVKP